MAANQVLPTVKYTVQFAENGTCEALALGNCLIGLNHIPAGTSLQLSGAFSFPFTFLSFKYLLKSSWHGLQSSSLKLLNKIETEVFKNKLSLSFILAVTS